MKAVLAAAALTAAIGTAACGGDDDSADVLREAPATEGEIERGVPGQLPDDTDLPREDGENGGGGAEAPSPVDMQEQLDCLAEAETPAEITACIEG